MIALQLRALLALILSVWCPVTAGIIEQHGRKEVACTLTNGDINSDERINVTDAIFLLGHLFLGSPTQLPPTCLKRQTLDLPSTGQSSCYDAIEGGGDRDWFPLPCDSASCAGQDALYSRGCPTEGRFFDNEDGTVTDTCTNLMWQKATADVNGDGQLTEKDATPWCVALLYCEDLGFAGKDDWRLPNVRELATLVDYGRSGPAIDPVFDSFGQYHWSSTASAELPFLAWFIGRYYGFIDYDSENLSIYTRAVRSSVECSSQNGDVNSDGVVNVRDAITILAHLFTDGTPLLPLCDLRTLSGTPDTGVMRCYDSGGDETPCNNQACPEQDGSLSTGCPPEERFVDNGDRTVTDTCTGLMWQKDTADVNGDGLNDKSDIVPWCAALTYCESLSFSGRDDWRLPNVRELESITDYGRESWALNPIFNTVQVSYWSSTSEADNPFHAWFVSHGIFTATNGKIVSKAVRAVRNTR